jgi:hypothetical protein
MYTGFEQNWEAGHTQQLLAMSGPLCFLLASNKCSDDYGPMVDTALFLFDEALHFTYRLLPRSRDKSISTDKTDSRFEHFCCA